MIIVTGTLAYDYIMEFPGEFGDHILPEYTHNINLSFIVKKFARRRGGTAGNISYTMGLLNTPHVLFSYAGNDFTDYKKAFDELHIDTSHIAIDRNAHTATGFALTDKMNNQIWGFYYGASEKSDTLQLRKVASNHDFVVVGPQGVNGSLSFIKQCIDLKIPYMFDPGFILTQVSDEDLTLGITHADTIIGNEYELELIAHRVNKFQTITKEKTVITTLGEKGTLIRQKNTLFEINPVKVDLVASTTGAGDAWRGGFLAGYQRGYDLQTCGQMGSVAGSFAVRHYGTQEHSYAVEEFQKVYRQFYGAMVEL